MSTASASTKRRAWWVLFAIPLAALVARVDTPARAGDPPPSTSSITLTLTKGLIGASTTTPICTGQQFQYTLSYNWWGGVPSGLLLTDVVPADLVVVGASVGLSPSPSLVTIVGNTVTFDLSGFTTSNGSITVSITVKFKPGVTCNGVKACNRATLKFKNDPAEGVTSNEICVTASAVNKWTLQKTLFSSGCGLIDGDVVFRVAVVNPSGSDVCGLNLNNVVLEDTVPAGASITSVYYANTGQTFTPPPATSTYALPSIPVLQVTAGFSWHVFYVHVLFPSSAFSSGQTVTNNAKVTFGLPCDPGHELTSSANVTLCNATPAGTISKTLNLNLYFPNNPVYTPCFAPGCCGRYRISYHNTGNVAQPSPFVIEDLIPPELNLTQIQTTCPTGTSAGTPVKLEIFTGTAFTPYTVGFPINYIVAGAPVVNTLPANVYISKVKWTYYVPIVANEWIHNYLDVCVRQIGYLGAQVYTGPTPPATHIVNTATAPNNLPSAVSATHDTTAAGCGPKILAAKFLSACGPSGQPQSPGPFLPGTVVRWRMTMANVGNVPASSCTITDTLPTGLTYVGNPTYYFGALPPWASASNPACTSMGTAASVAGPQALGAAPLVTVPTPQTPTWTFPNLPSHCDGTIEYLVIDFDALIGATAPPGLYSNRYAFSASNLATPVNSNVASVTVIPLIFMNLQKEIALSPGGPFQPSLTVAAGTTVYYRARILNAGNMTLENLCLLDIMPNAADDFWILPSYAPGRGSTFNLPADAVTAPIGCTVGYETAQNPKRTTTCVNACGSIATDPLGAVAVPFTNPVVPPGCQSFVVNGNALTLGPSASLDVVIQATVPAGTPSGATACNNFAAKALVVPNPADPSNVICLSTQSSKVCVTVLDDPCARAWGEGKPDGCCSYRLTFNPPSGMTSQISYVVASGGATVQSFTASPCANTTIPASLVGTTSGALVFNPLCTQSLTLDITAAGPTGTEPVCLDLLAEIVRNETKIYCRTRICFPCCKEPACPGTLCVYKFNDANGDGLQQLGEAGIAGFVFLVNGTAGGASLQTNASGVACYTLPQGTYTVVEQAQPGWTATSPTMQTVAVTSGAITNVSFGNRRGGGKGELCVKKFLDENRNGVQDPGEPALPGWTFEVRDPSGTVLSTLTTNAQGGMCAVLPSGTYTVVEVPQHGYTATTPTSQTVVVTPGAVANVTFGNRKTPFGQLCVRKFLDPNRSGVQDPGESTLAGWTFQVRDASGTIVATLTTSATLLSCAVLPAGTYTVTEVPQPGYTATTPTIQTVVVAPGAAANVTFGNRRTVLPEGNGKLCVEKFYDENRNGVKDAGEQGMSGWTFVVKDASGAVIATLTTNEQGVMCLEVKSGNYSVTEVMQRGYVATTPTAQGATVTPERETKVVFGNRKGDGGPGPTDPKGPGGGGMLTAHATGSGMEPMDGTLARMSITWVGGGLDVVPGGTITLGRERVAVSDIASIRLQWDEVPLVGTRVPSATIVTRSGGVIRVSTGRGPITAISLNVIGRPGRAGQSYSWQAGSKGRKPGELGFVTFGK